MNTQRTVQLSLILLLGIGALHAVAHLTPFEDAYITYRYAEHWASGVGPVYNIGERVEGCTSLVWTSVLAVAAKFGLPLLPVSQVLSVVAALALVWLTFGLSRVLLAIQTSNAWCLVPPLGVIASGTWAYYAGGGMEAPAFAALVTWAAWLAIAERSQRQALGAGMVFALAAMTRPEGAGYWLAVVAAVLVGQARRDSIALVAGFAALFGPFFCARWLYYGHPLPNTYYAKASPSVSLFEAGVVQTEAFLTSRAFWIPLAAALGLAIARRHERAWRIVAAIVLAAIFNTILVGGDAFAYYRPFLPALPFGSVALVAVARTLGSHRSASRTRLIVPGLVAAWVVFTFAVQFLPVRTLLNRRRQSEWQQVASVGRINSDYFAVGIWLRSHVDPNWLLATNAAGIVPYTSRLRTLDMLGLNDVHIAHLRQQLGRGIIGHEKHDAQYVLSRRPDVVLLGLPILTERRLTQAEFEAWFARWFPYLPGDRELFYSEAFRHEYAPVSVAVGDRYLTFFLRGQKGISTVATNDIPLQTLPI